MNPIDPDKVRELRAAGKGWRAIGVEFGRSEYSVRAAVDGAFAERTRLMTNERRARSRMDDGPAPRIKGPHLSDSITLRADVEARFAEIPADTRDLTGVAFGDPLPGRSALDRYRMERRI